MRGLEQGSRLTEALRRARADGGACAFVTFHRVLETEDLATDTVMPRVQFEAFLDAFADRYTVMSAGDAFQAHAQNALPRNGLVLTFDDGYEDLATVIAPLLKLRNIPATFFIASKYLTGTEGLSNDQLKELAACPLIEIGGHTRSHPHLRELSRQQQREEIVGNKSELEAIVGAELLSFAYPYGRRVDVDRSAMRAVRKAGYLGACTTQALQKPELGILCRGADPYQTYRLATNRTDPATLCARIDYLLGLER